MKCPHCGQEYTPIEGQRFCTFCGKPFEESQTDQQTINEEAATVDRSESSSHGDSGGPIENKYTPWEDLANLGFFQGLVQSVRQSLFSPMDFFSRLPVRGGFLNPLLYALILQTVGTMAGLVIGMAFNNPFLPKSSLSGVFLVVAGIMIPFLVPIRVYLWSGLLHAALYLLGGANEDFEATFRAVTYTSAVELLNAIPVAGGFIALGWGVFLLIVAVREIHRISTARAAAAVFLPLIVCCGVFVCGLFLALIGGAGLDG